MEVNTLCEKRQVTAGKGRRLNVTAGGKCGDTVQYKRRTFAHCLNLRRLMSYIYGAPILDVSRSHTTTQHSR